MAAGWFRRRFKIEIDTRRAMEALREYKEQLERRA